MTVLHGGIICHLADSLLSVLSSALKTLNKAWTKAFSSMWVLFWLSGLHPMWHTVIPATEIWVCHTLLQRLSSHCESLRYQTSARRGSNIGASRINTDKTASMFRNTVLCKLNVNSSNYCWTVSQRSVTVLYAGEVEWIPTCLSANIKAVKRISQHCWLFAYRNNLLLHLFQ